MGAVDSPARVLVVEDDPPIRSAVEVALKGVGYEVRAEPDGQSIEVVAAEFVPDLAILDVRLPAGPDGFAIGRLLRRTTDVPLIFLTAADSIEDRLEGFEAGADDYLVKPFSIAELLARTQALLRRYGRLAFPPKQVGDLVIDQTTRTVTRAGEAIELTRTEWELLVALAQRPGQVLSKMQLLTHVWGFDAYDANVVEVHLSALRRKIEAHGPRLVQTVRGMGYVLKE